MNEVENDIVCMSSNINDYTICVVYPKALFSSPDEKAKELSKKLRYQQIHHHLVGIDFSSELKIKESMIMVYDVITGKHLLFSDYDEFHKILDANYKTDSLAKYGFFFSLYYVSVQNAYLAVLNSTTDFPCKESRKDIIDKLFDFLLDIRLKEAGKIKKAKIIAYNKQFEEYDDYVSEDDVARENGCYIDDDGDWIPYDDDYDF